MKAKWPPNPSAVVQDLADVLQLLHPAIDAGSDEGVRYFEGRHEDKIDPWLHSHLTRFYAKRWLANNGLDRTGFQLVDQPMSGLLLRSTAYDLRVLKAEHRPNRLTGQSERRIQTSNITRSRQEYFYQPSMEFDEDTPPMFLLRIPQRLRLLVLWDVNRNHQLQNLELACPKAYDDTLNVVHTHWWVPLSIEAGEAAVALDATFDDAELLDDIAVDSQLQDAPESATN